MSLRLLSDVEKLLIGSVLGFVFLVAALVLSFFAKEPYAVHISLCLLGASTGWLTGILASPFTEEEKSRFTDLAKGFLALGTGFVLAKFDGIIVAGIQRGSTNDPDLLVLRLALFATCFVIGFLFTIVFRLYGIDDAERKRRKLTKLRQEARMACERLRAEEES